MGVMVPTVPAQGADISCISYFWGGRFQEIRYMGKTVPIDPTNGMDSSWIFLHIRRRVLARLPYVRWTVIAIVKR